MKTHLTKLDNGSRTCAMTEPVSGRQPVLALVMRLLWAAALALPAFGAQAAVVFTSLHSFGVFTNGVFIGESPPAALVQGSDGNFYGTTTGGGTNNMGTVFRIGTNGALTSFYSFTGGNDGGSPNGLVQGRDGYFYGTTLQGGTNGGFGTVFRISSNGALTTLYSFGKIQGAYSVPLDGGLPYAGLVQGSDGYFYGTTAGGGMNDKGTVFRIGTNGALTCLYSLTGGNDGYDPNGLVQGRDGYLYGTTGQGGLNGWGTLFQISTNGVLTSLYSFTGGNDGRYPSAALVQGSDGYFYGTIEQGGTVGAGAVFQISTNGVLTNLYSFTGGTDGAFPKAALAQGSDGYFYGTTSIGRNNMGTVFRIGTNGALTTLHLFTGGNDGGSPYAGLVQGSDGCFYGTTIGNPNWGTVFRISTNGVLTSLHSFTGGNDGGYPSAALVQGRDGYFYGTTSGGGTNGQGTVFQISTNGALTSFYSFTGGTDGASPNGLVQGRDGNFYGTTGRNNVFRISTNGVLTNLYSFTGGTDGAFPKAALAQGSDGYFYGTTLQGGTNNMGTVFRISTNGVLTSLHSFTGGNDGGYPSAALVQGRDGYFYGTTSTGGNTNFNGMHGLGTLFKISTNGALTSLYSFTGGNNNYDPNGLVQGSDGYFYGTTAQGGQWGAGTVFQISTNGALTSLYSFIVNDGTDPVAGLVEGSDGSFYGTTYYGGVGLAGTVFRLTIVPQPQLTIIPSGPYMILTWPTNYAGFTLQSTTNLGLLAVWSTNFSPPIVVNGKNTVTNRITGSQQFFRLSQ